MRKENDEVEDLLDKRRERGKRKRKKRNKRRRKSKRKEKVRKRKKVRRRNKSEEKKSQSFYFYSSSQLGFLLHSFFIPSPLFLRLFTSSFFWFKIPLPLI
jgi:hypothetical protein